MCSKIAWYSCTRQLGLRLFPKYMVIPEDLESILSNSSWHLSVTSCLHILLWPQSLPILNHKIQLSLPPNYSPYLLSLLCPGKHQLIWLLLSLAQATTYTYHSFPSLQPILHILTRQIFLKHKWDNVLIKAFQRIFIICKDLHYLALW